MDKRRGRVLAVAAFATCLLTTSATHAACTAPGFNPTGLFCNGCRYEGHMTLPHDEVCERPYTQGSNPNGAVLDIRGHRMVQRAKHGIAGVTGVYMAYSPSKGYVGKDEFTVEVDFRQAGVAGKFYVHWNVTVQ